MIIKPKKRENSPNYYNVVVETNQRYKYIFCYSAAMRRSYECTIKLEDNSVEWGRPNQELKRSWLSFVKSVQEDIEEYDDRTYQLYSMTPSELRQITPKQCGGLLEDNEAPNI